MTVDITPRTNIQGAHQQGVSVALGAGLKKTRSGGKPLYTYKRFYAFVALALPLLATDWIPAKSYLGSIKASLIQSFSALAYLPTGFQIVALLSLSIAAYFAMTVGRPYLVFAYNCFLKPFLGHKNHSGVDSEDHQQRLEQFYEGQAQVYDVTRRRFDALSLIK